MFGSPVDAPNSRLPNSDSSRVQIFRAVKDNKKSWPWAGLHHEDWWRFGKNRDTISWRLASNHVTSIFRFQKIYQSCPLPLHYLQWNIRLRHPTKIPIGRWQKFTINSIPFLSWILGLRYGFRTFSGTQVLIELQYSHLITRRCREHNVYAELMPCTTKIEDINFKPRGLRYIYLMYQLD